MSKQFTLGKEERLKSRKQTDLLFSSGKKFTMGSFRIFYLIDSAEEKTLQFGVGVSAKLFKKASSRNRVKRIVREAYRLQKNELKAKLAEKNKGLTVFYVYTAKELPVYTNIYEQVKKILNKLLTLTGE